MENESIWSNKAFWSQFIRYGASTELLLIVFSLVFLIICWGLMKPRRLAAIADGIDGTVSKIGRLVAWLALLMVLQQVLVVFMQAIFKQSSMSIGPFLPSFNATPQWFSEELRLYNALLIVLGTGYTMVEGGHVRVDLIYGGLKHRTKRLLDLIGACVFLVPFTVVLWYFSWFYMWRSISSSSVNLSRDLIKFRTWKLESSSNPSGFDDVYMFKVLIPVFALVMFFQAISIILRSIAALRDQAYLESLPQPSSGH